MAVKDISVFSLNVFGLYGISPKRKERVLALAQYLSRSDYDIVLLQEVWTQEDYLTLHRGLILSGGGPFSFSHYFANGIIGTGTCIFTKNRIRFTAFHSFGLNGYPQYLNHGDWFAAKGLGLAVCDIEGFEVHVYVSHYHAEYDDIYMGHQVIHALESAQWIKLTSVSADLTIFAGDFNLEPSTVPIQLLKSIGHLKDSWEEVHGQDSSVGATCETPTNSFTPKESTQAFPLGKRIDYIMYRSGVETEATARKVCLPLESRVPGQNYSFSDHEALLATIRIRNKEDGNSYVAYKKSLRIQNVERRQEIVSKAVDMILLSEARVASNRIKYCSIAFALLIALIMSSYIPSYVETSLGIKVELALLILRLLATMIMSFYLLMGSLFTQRELNELRSSRLALKIIHDMDNLESNPWDP